MYPASSKFSNLKASVTDEEKTVFYEALEQMARNIEDLSREIQSLKREVDSISSQMQ